MSDPLALHVNRPPGGGGTNPARRRLGRTDLEVFPLNLGGNVFGWTADRDATFAVLDAYREAGGNFIDTADVYSKWVPGHVGGESEALIGDWMKVRGARNEIVLATKVGLGGPGLDAGLGAEQIRRGCERSLARLGVERIDLFYAHKDDPETPLEETLGAFDALVRAGKVRAIGASHYTPQRLREALDVSAKLGLAAYAVVQPEYNLVTRELLEGPLATVTLERGLAVCPYYALASGFLTGKHRPGEAAAGARGPRVQRYLDDPHATARLETLRAVARERGATPAQVALAWQLHKPFVTAPIASATSPAQVRELVASVQLELDAEALRRLDA
jgi:aryl-alcohol dehydrogenase (NADP+)